ncbi:helix-turn-helix domain-containing protein [Vibrio fluvialis]
MKKEMPAQVQAMLERLGSAVKSARIDRGLRQADITEATGLSQNIVTNLESGKGSTLASLLAVLSQLDLVDPIIETIESGVSSDSTRERVKPSRAKSPVVLEKGKPALEGVTKQELMPKTSDPIELTDVVPDDQLEMAIKRYPARIFRINKGLAIQLSSDPMSNIAVFTNTVNYQTPGGAPRNREVYFAASMQAASKVDVPWTVGGLVRRSNAVVVAVLSESDASGREDKLASLLLDLRKTFGKSHVFVDEIVIESVERSYLRKDDREVRGQLYRDLFESRLTQWMKECQVS